MSVKEKGQRVQVQDALFDWVEKALNDAECACPIVWDNTGGTREKPPFVSLQMIGGGRRGFPFKSGVNPESGERTFRYDMRQTVSIHGWGESCMDRLETISDSIDFGENIAFLRKRGIVVNRLTDVAEVAEDRANDSETHGFFDIAVTFIRIVKQQVDWIERVEVHDDMPANPDINIDLNMEEENGRN